MTIIQQFNNSIIYADYLSQLLFDKPFFEPLLDDSFSLSFCDARKLVS